MHLNRAAGFDRVDVYCLDADRCVWDGAFWDVVFGIILVCHVTGGDAISLQVSQSSAGCGDVAGLDDGCHEETEEN